MIEVRRYQRLDGEVPLTDWLAVMRGPGPSWKSVFGGCP